MQVYGECYVHPEPEYLICTVSRQVSSLDDVKSSSQTDNNAAKTMALDHLGVIAARMRSSMLRAKQGADEYGVVGLKPLDEVLSASLGSFHALTFCVGRVSFEC